MAWKKYQCRFYSENKVGGAYVSPTSDPNQQRWEIAIWKETGTDVGYTTFKCTSEGFKLKMGGRDDNLASPIKTTSLTFDMIVEGAGQEAIIDDILSVATGNENEFWVQVAMYDVVSGSWVNWWRGVLLGDLVQVQDIGINNIINVQATDGLTQLKNKPWGATTYGGTRSCMYILKACLRNVPLISARYGTSSEFIAHIAFYYNKAMSGGLTGSDAVDSDTWREDISHDPLTLSSINTELFKYDDGTYWPYYDIMLQILSAFQLRIMMCQVSDGTDEGPMWLLQNPFNYHDWSGNPNTDQLIFFHGNDLTTEDALSYKNDFSTKLVNPTQRLSGGISTYLPPLLSYKSIYEHKIMQNLALGPFNINSEYYSDANPSDTTDLYWGTTPNAFHYNIVKNDQGGEVGGNGGFHAPSYTRILITGEVEYSPYHWATWDWFNNNNASISWGTYTNAAFLNQYVMARLGLLVSSRSEFTADGTSWLLYNYYWLGSSRYGILSGSVPWIGPSEGTSGSPYIGFWNSTWPSVWCYDDNETGANVCPWGTDVGADNDWLFWYNSEQTLGSMAHWGWFTPLVHSVNGIWVAEGDSYEDWNDTWGIYNSGIGTGNQAFSVISPLVPVVGNQYNTIPAEGFIQTIRLYYSLGRDLWDNDGNGYYRTCVNDWSNQQELLHENRGIGYKYFLNQVRIYIIGNENIQDGYYDYSIGYFTNDNGTPSEAEVQDPEIVIGDEPEFNSQYAVDTENEGVSPVGFGQFWITNTNPATSTNEPYYLGVDTTRWICTWESDNSGNWLKLHQKRCKMQVSHHYKLKEKLDLSFQDRSPTTAYATDIKMRKLGFSAIYNWYGAGSTEQSTWIDNLYMVSGGEFTAGTMEWKVCLIDCLTFDQDSLTNNSYASNNSS